MKDANYSKFMKYILSKKKNVGEFAIIVLTQECIQLLQGNLPLKINYL